jgi:hypothetical protein
MILAAHGSDLPPFALMREVHLRSESPLRLHTISYWPRYSRDRRQREHSGASAIVA